MKQKRELNCFKLVVTVISLCDEYYWREIEKEREKNRYATEDRETEYFGLFISNQPLLLLLLLLLQNNTDSDAQLAINVIKSNHYVDVL